MSIIVIEGIDGVGKSTLAQGLAEKIKAEVRHLPTPWFYENAKRADSNLGKRALYVLDFQRARHKQRNVYIYDRHIPSQLAYDLLNPTLSMEDWYSCYGEEIRIPLVTFYLDCPINTSWKRINERQKNIDDEYEQLEKQEKLKKNYEDHVIPFLLNKGWNIQSIKAEEDTDTVLYNVFSLLCSDALFKKQV